MRNRAASAIITFFGAIINSVLTIQVLATWRSIKWEPESEWELSGDKWQLTGVKIIWGLLFLYFASAASHKPSHVRFYRDYSIADFSFCAFFTALATYAAFLSPTRAGVCEAFSHHPELMRDMLEMGLNLENCEQWLERAVFAGLAFLFVVMVIRVSSFPPLCSACQSPASTARLGVRIVHGLGPSAKQLHHQTCQTGK
ncbi:hypothetical protein D9613_004910 [Agrocybe pediades]|uniref:Uncharacterized protein n=1 Tax=Agrocybe pediades TaxID=84607 RepID=A0A8H4VU00_9AGAR|nr:hypothetical protein D9613_004910 [Agrocybe pediades]